MSTPANSALQEHRSLSLSTEETVLLFANFGMYHLARLNALKRVCHTHAIEFASSQKLYGWKVNKDTSDFTTLHDGPIEEASTAEVVISLIRLWKVMEALKPSHIFIPGYVDSRAVVAALWARTHRAQSILMYETTERDKIRTPLFEFLKSLIIRLLFSHGFVGGSRTREYLEKLRFPSRNIVEKYDVVDNDFFTEGCDRCRSGTRPEEWHLPKNYFLLVARLAKEKNASSLFEAFAAYRRQGGTWDLVLVGKGDEEERLKSIAESEGVADVIHFAGFKNGDELLPFYSFAGCFVLPSKSEPWGLVVNEAMASGLPVLVSEVCGCAPDLVRDGENGYSFNPSDVQQLTSLLHRLSSITFAERSRMGARSREIVACYGPPDWANSAMKVMSLWR